MVQIYKIFFSFIKDTFYLYKIQKDNLMRIFIPFLLLIFINCKSQYTNSNRIIDEEKVFNLTENLNCPENGNCNFTIIPLSSLVIEQDEFGSLYPNIITGNKLIVKFQYQKKPIENTADSNYTEIIYFELDNDNINLHLQNEKLQEVKLLFGRLCYCKGETGYYKVNKGDLKVRMDYNNLTLDLQFEVKKIPQIIQTINESIVFK